VQVDHERGFGQVFKALACSIKKKYELNFIIDVASFQLHQKSSNLAMFWLPKNTLKLR